MTEDQENKLIIAYLQDVIAQMTAYKEYKLEYDEMEKKENLTRLKELSFVVSKCAHIILNSKRFIFMAFQS